MSIATTSLKYGWKVLAILTIGTGSIFVADNVLNRITTKDRIEVILAVVERCLATQTGTNPATYGVDPPSIVRTWTDTNGASVIVTNAIAWRDDLSMKVELDAKLEALCPYYVDTNSVYDGTTNIVMHTFTGLLTSLDLGDHTNFTAIPAIGTNAATFGPWAWRNYITAWQERYKVLNALKVVRISTLVNKYLFEGRQAWSFENWTNRPWEDFTTNGSPIYRYGGADNAGAQNELHGSHAMLRMRAKYEILENFSTNMNLIKLSSFLITSKFNYADSHYFVNYFFADDVVCPGFETEFIYIGTFSYPTNGQFPYQNTNYFGNSEEPVPDKIPPLDNYEAHGWELRFPATLLTFQFNYATNKFW